jgi:hypothetical protein
VKEYTYYLTVKVDETNQHYMDELAKFVEQERLPYHTHNPAPRQYETRTTLEVRLTEAQWIAVQRAVLETFK